MAKLDSLLPVYSIMHSDNRIGTAQHQAAAYVACATQKEAIVLIGTEASHWRDHGGSIGNNKIIAFCNQHPGEVFYERSHGVFCHPDDWSDEAKHIRVDLSDPELYGYETDHDAFGQVSLSRVSGGGRLFQVDYDTGHHIRLTINTATLVRSHGHDRVHSREIVAEVALSEVQFARLVAGVGSEGVPCTLNHYRHPKSGEFLSPRLPDKHVADTESRKAEVRKKADIAMESVTKAEKLLREIMGPGSVKKSDLAEVLELIQHAGRYAGGNLAYAVQSAEEAIDKATDSGRAEVDAHIEFAMARLGERALGEKMTLALKAAGVDISMIGRHVDALVLEDQVDTDHPST